MKNLLGQEEPESSPPETTNYRSFSDNLTNPTRSDPLAADDEEGALPVVIGNTLHDYRGFETSMADMFAYQDQERVDCCSMTCCGLLQSDRDRYLLTGVTPPGPLKRCTVHVCLPLLIFFMAGLGAMRISDQVLNHVVSTGLILMLLMYLYQQTTKGRMKRLQIRKDLLYTKYQLQHNHANLLTALEQRPDDDDSVNAEYLGKQGRWDLACAHPCCFVGCYPDDRVHNKTSDNKRNDLCSCLFRKAWPACCGMIVTCCGICAVAQEARELEKVILPAKYRRIDYITMQPVLDYYPAIYQAKRDDNNTTKRMPPLSRLSIRLGQWLAGFVGLAFLWSLVSPLYWKYVVNVRKQNVYNLADFLILLAVFGQALVLLCILAWLTNRPKPSQLSMDAIVKMFASGFFLSTSLAVFWEVFLGLLVKTVVSLILAIVGVTVMEEPDTQMMKTSHDNRGTALWPIASMHQDFLESFGRQHPVLYTLYIFVATFLLAGLVEEICKYFGYRMCDDHADFLSAQDLTQANSMVVAHHFDEDEDDDHEPEARRSVDFSQHRQSHQAHGAAITLAMLAVAMGFGCCENLVYVFVYSSASIEQKVSVLIARSIFPVHPIAAALQSIGVCQRQVEKKTSIQFGRHILGPAVLFHGLYDFMIVWIDFLANRTRGVAASDDDVMPVETTSVAAAVLSFCISIAIMMAALIYYWRQAKAQRQRLYAMDQEMSVDQSRLI